MTGQLNPLYTSVMYHTVATATVTLSRRRWHCEPLYHTPFLHTGSVWQRDTLASRLPGPEAALPTESRCGASLTQEGHSGREHPGRGAPTPGGVTHGVHRDVCHMCRRASGGDCTTACVRATQAASGYVVQRLIALGVGVWAVASELEGPRGLSLAVTDSE